MNHFVKALESGRTLVLEENSGGFRKAIVKWYGLYVYWSLPSEAISDVRVRYVSQKSAHKIAVQSLRVERREA